MRRLRLLQPRSLSFASFLSIACVSIFWACEEGTFTETLPADAAQKLAYKHQDAVDKHAQIAVGEIQILNLPALPKDYFFAPLVNFFHSVTRRDVITDELHFKTGDTIEGYEIYDAERYIRLLDPIKTARVVPTLNEETKKTDILVVTQDRLSAYVHGAVAGTGGYNAVGLEAGDTSLFGRLYSVAGSYARENFRDFVGFSTGKKRIAGSRWQVGAQTLNGFYNTHHNYTAQSLSAAYPFLTDGQKHSFRFDASQMDGVQYDYLGSGVRRGLDTATGNTFDLIHRMHTENVSLQYLYGVGVKSRIEVGGGLERNVVHDSLIASHDQFTLAKTEALQISKTSQDFYEYERFDSHAASLVLNTRWGDFTPYVNFRRYLFQEDQFEGLRTTTKVTHANPSLGLSDLYTRTTANATYAAGYLNKSLRLEAGVGRSAIFWSERYRIARNDFWNADLRLFYFTRFGTLATRQFASEGSNLDILTRKEIAREFSRGFLYGSLLPSAGYLGSIEYRSPALKLPYFLFALVAFFDYAGVGQSLSALEWSPIVGTGFRSMLHEFDNNVFRFDIAYNLRSPAFNLIESLQFGMEHTF